MKRTFFFLFIFLFCASLSFADNAQRKTSTGRLTSSQVIKSTPGTVYDVEIVATAAGGYAVVFDSATSATGTELVELREATQNNSKHANLGSDGIKAHQGIYLFLNNAEAIVYYH